MPKISYLVTCCSETDTLDRLLARLEVCVKGTTDEVVILLDTAYSQATLEITNKYDKPNPNIRLELHALANNYGGHKNYGVEKCSGDFVFQIDGDEMLPDYLLGENLHALLDANPTIEAYAIPRINAWHGLTEAHAQRWGWSIDTSPTYNRIRAAWPDYQWRLFKRDYPRIEFKKRLHERIDGFKTYVILPAEEDFALYHDKTIEVQIATNQRYNKDFTTDENRGISDEKVKHD